MLNVVLLGEATFSIDGEVPRSELVLAGRMLACYLFSFPERAHRREKLADLFWGELDTARSRAALNTAIWRIRKLLDSAGSRGGAHLLTVGDDVLFEPAPFVHVDVRELDDIFRRTSCVSRRDGFSEAESQQINAAVQNYRGSFLDGYSGDWVIQERERLDRLFVRSAIALMRSDVRRGEYERALDCGQKILAIEPFHESIHQDVMLLLVLTGQQANAVIAYKRLKKTLNAELGIDPMPEMRQLHSEIMSGAIFCNLARYTDTRFGLRPA